MNWVGSPSNSNFTSDPGVTAGSGIDVAQSRSVVITSGLEDLNGQPANGRYQFFDLNISFNSPVSDPVLHTAGLGGAFNTNGFTTELELLTPGASLAKLSGTGVFSVTGDKILNTATLPTASGSGVGTGSVHAQGTNITNLSFRAYIRGGSGATGTILGTDTTEDAWSLGVSIPPGDGAIKDTSAGNACLDLSGTIIGPVPRLP